MFIFTKDPHQTFVKHSDPFLFHSTPSLFPPLSWAQS